jgi:hypothetical protein
MSVSNTGGHGRGGQGGRIIGDVINHGKHDLWGKPNVHYHHGMKVGQTSRRQWSPTAQQLSSSQCHTSPAAASIPLCLLFLPRRASA